MGQAAHLSLPPAKPGSRLKPFRLLSRSCSSTCVLGPEGWHCCPAHHQIFSRLVFLSTRRQLIYLLQETSIRSLHRLQTNAPCGELLRQILWMLPEFLLLPCNIPLQISLLTWAHLNSQRPFACRNFLSTSSQLSLQSTIPTNTSRQRTVAPPDPHEKWHLCHTSQVRQESGDQHITSVHCHSHCVAEGAAQTAHTPKRDASHQTGLEGQYSK